MGVEGDYLRDLLHDAGVATSEGSKVDGTVAERYHWHEDILTIEPFEAMELLNTLNIELGSVMPNKAASV